VTHDNMLAPWVHFELGAVFKADEKNRACPLLIDVELSDLPGNSPLRIFQVKQATRDGLRDLLSSVNCGWDQTLEDRLGAAMTTFDGKRPGTADLWKAAGAEMMTHAIHQAATGLRTAELLAKMLGDATEAKWRAKRRMLIAVPPAEAAAALSSVLADVNPFLQEATPRLLSRTDLTTLFSGSST
jgi:hypothetical protein